MPVQPPSYFGFWLVCTAHKAGRTFLYKTSIKGEISVIGKYAYVIRRASRICTGIIEMPVQSPSYFVNQMMIKHPFWQSMLMRVFLYVWLGACDGNGVSLFYLYLEVQCYCF